MALLLAGSARGSTGANCFEGIFACAVDIEDPMQTGDLKDLDDVAVATDEHKLASKGP